MIDTTERIKKNRAAYEAHMEAVRKIRGGEHRGDLRAKYLTSTYVVAMTTDQLCVAEALLEVEFNEKSGGGDIVFVGTNGYHFAKLLDNLVEDLGGIEGK